MTLSDGPGSLVGVLGETRDSGSSVFRVPPQAKLRAQLPLRKWQLS